MEEGGGALTFELTEASQREREEQETLLREFELRRRARGTLVPTDDAKVRTMLRQLGEPITLFGEKEMERRERLRKLIAEREAQGQVVPGAGAPALVIEQAAAVQTELFYTEGSTELRDARAAIAQWSLPRAAARVVGAKRRRGDAGVLEACLAVRRVSEAGARRIAQVSSEIGDDRALGGARFSPDGHLLATCSWRGHVGLWRASDASCARVADFAAHAERATDVAWHPHASTRPDAGDVAAGQEGDGGGAGVDLATGCADGSATLWGVNGGLRARLQGHTERLGRIAFHPLGRHLGTASFDATWRLWDIETGETLLEQEGHSRGVYAVAFHPDGALAGSVGLDAIGRLWDCRTGRTALVLEGHVKQILAIDFAPDGWHVATGSDDHSVRVWDIRKRRCAYVLPAHRSLVSAVRWQPAGGHYLLTAGYDCTAKLWSGRDFSLLRTLAGHEGKVMAADISPMPGAHLIGTAAYDRTIKLWAPEEEPEVLGADSPREGYAMEV